MNKKTNKLTLRKTANTQTDKQIDSRDFIGPPNYIQNKIVLLC